jgi:hypothetical protein
MENFTTSPNNPDVFCGGASNVSLDADDEGVSVLLRELFLLYSIYVKTIQRIFNNLEAL